MRCEKHNEETAVSCGRCESPVCPKCMVHSDVGVRCKKCAPAMKAARFSRGSSVLGLMVAGIVGLVVVGSVGGAFSGSDGPGDAYDYPYEDWDYDVSVNEVVDPWVPPASRGEPSRGHRFVAIDVTVGTTASNDSPYWTGQYDFKLTDAENFAYEAAGDGESPQFPDEVTLEPGERARGWVTFEVADGNGLKSLTSYDTVIPLGGGPPSSR